MIHIVFQHSDVGVLAEAMTLDAKLRGEVLLMEDDYSLGPIGELYTPGGMENRKTWWRSINPEGDESGTAQADAPFRDNKTVQALRERLTASQEETLWIWAAQNKHDVSGYYWLIGQLKELPGRIFILYLNNLPFISDKGSLFYPVNLFNIPPREFIKAKKLSRAVTTSEFEIDPDEWTKLGLAAKNVRILEGGKKLAQFDDDYFDESIKKCITVNWQTAHKIMLSFLHKAGQMTSDAFLGWRLRHIIAQDDIEVQGEVKKMKDFEIRLKMAQPAAATQPV